MKMVLLGTGTSHGVPVIGCRCKVCRSSDVKDNRLRCSAYLSEPADILIDVGPEFRIQALRQGIRNLDGVLLTHAHADHLHGIDDLRIFSHTEVYDPHKANHFATAGKGLAIYTGKKVVDSIRIRFDYIFKDIRQGGGRPKLNLIDAEAYGPQNPICIKGIEIVPVALKHGIFDDTGWILSERKDGVKKSIVYLTDLNSISEESIELIKSVSGQIEYLVVDGLRLLSHSTHFSFEEALSLAEKLNPKNVCIIHITHDLFHFQIQEYIDGILNRYPYLLTAKKAGGYIGPGYDGMELIC